MLHAGDQPPQRVDLPSQWPVVAALSEPRRLTRHFNCPTGLMPADRVELVLAHFPPLGDVQVNDQPLGRSPAVGAEFRVEITPHLQSRNLISVALQDASAESDIPPQAHLEIFAG